MCPARAAPALSLCFNYTTCGDSEISSDGFRPVASFEALIQETPYQALLVTSGKQALKTVQTLKPNLVLLDYRLPDMNGLEIYDRLHKTKGLENVPAILMSANMPKQRAQQRDIRALSKPFELSELLENIETLLAEE